MKSGKFTNVPIRSINEATSIMSKKDKGTPDRGTPPPERPDRGGHPGRPDRGFEDDLPGEPTVPDRNVDLPGDLPGDVRVPNRGQKKRGDFRGVAHPSQSCAALVG